ncbi:MAG: hypothetical protein RLZZ476_457 [Verrucomicrobiota bacterium]|jgi:hypothetical protein
MNRVATILLIAASTLMARDEEKSAAGDQERFLAVLMKNFAAWDADRDGLLSANEINKLVESAEVRGEDAAAVAALKRASRFRIATLPSFTLEHLQGLAKAQPLEKGMPDLPAMFGSSLKRIAKTKRVLFSPEGPRIETIRQGRMGNCFSLAPLAALAHERPDYVRKQMIRPLEDGRYVVKLGQEEVQVTAPTDAEIALTSENEDGSLWVNVYEKAAGLAHNAKKPADKRDATGLDALNRGGSAGTQLAFITGREMFRVSCSFAKKKDLPQAEYDKHMAELRAALTAATKENRLMTCGTLKTTIPGLTPNHAYAILSYDSATNVIRVWNPHGDTREVKGEPGPKNGYPIRDGIFELPLTVFVKEFSGTAYEIVPPHSN